jgi:hypothetical protein
MATKPDDLLPTAKDYMKKLALAEAEEASKEAAKHAAAEAEKKALLDHLTKPSGVSDEEGIRRTIKIIERAVANGRTEVQVHRFPNQLCTDKGRAIIQQEAGWENTLTGVPKESISSGRSTSVRADTSSGSRSSIIPAGCPEMSA